MNFSLTREQGELQKALGDFVEREVLPRELDIDREGVFPQDLFQKLGEMNFFALRYPEEYGGISADTTTFCLCIEALARGDLSLAAVSAMQSLMGTDFIYRFGTEDHKKRLLKPALEGKKIATIAFTEPSAGSDLSSIKTRVIKDGDHYVLQGQKTWITSANQADFVSVAATFDTEKGLSGLDFFLVEKGTPGFSVGKAIPKLGLRGSETAEIYLDNCRVPLENRLSKEEGTGFANMKVILNEIRTMTGALSLGLAQRALETSVQYAKDRVQFGRPISKFQAIRFEMAEMATQLSAARHLVYYAAWLMDEKKPAAKSAAMAKLFASEAANTICDRAMRILASYGFSMEYPVQKYFRDSRFLLIGGGTSEILKMIIGKEVEREGGGMNLC